jgi:hypothetical protein
MDIGGLMYDQLDQPLRGIKIFRLFPGRLQKIGRLYLSIHHPAGGSAQPGDVLIIIELEV